MPYPPTYKADMDNLVEGQVPVAPDFLTLAELAVKVKRKPTAVRNSLRRLVKAGLVQYAWFKDPLGARPVYFIAPLPGETNNE